MRTLDGRSVVLGPGLPLDARIALVADAQHGVVTLAQLATCGLSDRAVRGRVASGSLHRLYRGVYVPGHRRLPRHGALAAAVLACGVGAAISHRTAAWLHGLCPDSRRVIDVSIAKRCGRRHGNVLTHSAARVPMKDIWTVDSIPVTSVARTLLDCAPTVGQRGVERLCQKAEVLQLFDLRAIERVLADGRGHPGYGTVRRALADLSTSSGVANPGAEDALLQAFRAAGLPEPECNVPIQRPDGSFAFADFLWRQERLIVEADTAYHDSTASYRSDRRRDRALLALGYRTIRFSDEDMRDPAACAAEVAGLVAEGRPQKRTSGVRS